MSAVEVVVKMMMLMLGKGLEVGIHLAFISFSIILPILSICNLDASVIILGTLQCPSRTDVPCTVRGHGNTFKGNVIAQPTKEMFLGVYRISWRTR